ncbi:MAG: nucleotidyltransferase domain-containing protein [Nitrospirae bacterium]|nr:nucleotidyltransferase domain-containing protein [Nitrospirota bacterium]
MLDTSVLADIFREYPYIAAAYLFGSHAKGTAGPMSDVDIALLLNDGAPSGIDLIHEEDYLSYRIQKALGVSAEVDVIDLNGKKLVFQHNVLRTGRLIYEVDRDTRVRFTARTISEFCDFEPRLRMMQKYYLSGLKKRLAKI